MKNSIRFILIIFLLFSTSFLFAQTGKIKGSVRSASGEGIPFATIALLNTLIGTVTHKEGNFKLEAPQNEYTISVSALGFATKTLPIRVGEGETTINVVLDESAQTLNEVVVTGTKTAVSKDYVPFKVSVVSREQIEQSSESALLPVLSQQVAGLFVTQRGVTGFGIAAGAAGAITMRGLGGSPTTGVLVLINGNPQFSGLFGHPLPDAYVASDVERVEVIHGAGSVLYGTNAMGGVINIITRNQNRDGYTLNGRVMYGSFNTQKYMANAGFRKKGFSVMASFNNDRTDGHRPFSNFNIRNGYLKLGYRFNNHISIGAESSLAKYEAANPGPEGGTPGFALNILRGVASFYLSNQYDKTLGMLNFSITMVYIK